MAETTTTKKGSYRPEYYLQNRERIAAKNKAWREANPEKYQEGQRNWRANSEGRTYVDGKYVNYIGYAHPICNPSGITRFHRLILWDRMNGEDASCHWGCGKMLSWSKKHPVSPEALIVDHLDGDGLNNDPDNLVPSCHLCNIGRAENRGAPRRVFGKCEGPQCGRDASTHTPDRVAVVCTAHYNQSYSGKELRPLETRLNDRIVTDTGHQCSTCLEVKPFSDYYQRDGKPKKVCKVCEGQRSARARAARLALNTKCSIADCHLPVDIKGLCTKHYSRSYYKAGGAS